MTDTHTEALKPCPFCGGRVIRENGHGTDPSDSILHVAKPGGNNCPVADGFSNWNCDGDVSDLWNTRAAIEALPARNDELTPANRDCLVKAKPGEPMFIILGRDPDGGNIVRLWAQRRFDAGDTEHAGPVFAIADAMDTWRAAGHLPESAPDASAYPPIARNDERALKLVEAVKTAIQHAYEEGVEDGTEWAETTKFIGEQEPQWIDSVARVTSLQIARSLADTQPSGETR
jgi:hypothetical protein